MSYEKKVHEGFELPAGDYTTVLRLRDVALPESYSTETAQRFAANLSDFDLSILSQQPRVTSSEGAIFAEFRINGLKGSVLAVAAAGLVLPAIASLELTPEILAGVDSSRDASIEVAPELLFRYMPNDASLAVQEALAALKELPGPSQDSSFDLEMMFNAPSAIR